MFIFLCIYGLIGLVLGWLKYKFSIKPVFDMRDIVLSILFGGLMGVGNLLILIVEIFINSMLFLRRFIIFQKKNNG